MTLSRRQLLAGLAAVPVLQAKDEHLMFVGTYSGPKSKGIYAWRFSDGKLTPLGAVGETANPSFVALHPSGKYLYAVNETKNGSVTAFSVDRSTGKLTELNSQPSKGNGPCYVSVDGAGKNVLVANYGGGSVAVLPIEAKDGRLKEPTAFVEHKGSSVTKRQNKPYAHCIRLSPDGGYALVSDLGMDEVLVYRFDANAGTLALHNSAKLKPGTGPRHFAFHPNKRMVYVIGELGNTITGFAWDNGQLYERQAPISTLPAEYKGESYCAEIVVHPSGKWLYGSNRGHDSIARFAIDKEGKLTAAGHTPTGGQVPRNFALDPSGQWLFAANQKTDNIVLFRVGKDGALTSAGQTIEVSQPVCVRFL